jgi:phospholipid/cholesterol/gamma-HCH transport system ATP-binding protein
MGWSDRILQKDASFTVMRGTVFAILGGSGCGKSTLMRYLVGLEQPMAGDINYVGKGEPSLTVGRPPYGVMFQGGALLGSMTVAENVALPLIQWTDLPKPAIAAVVRSKLRLVQLEQASEKLPSEISGGMKKRAAIARAMALDPDLLFLDEPSAGLDPVSSAELDELILTLKRTLGLTVVIVTHELESIYGIADECIFLHKESATILARGNPRQLRDEATDPRIVHFFHRQPRKEGGDEPESVEPAERRGDHAHYSPSVRRPLRGPVPLAAPSRPRTKKR